MRVAPSSRAVAICQDKLTQRRHFESAPGVPQPRFAAVPTLAAAREAAAALGFPLVLKARRGSYDGRGNAVATCDDDLAACCDSLGGFGASGDALYAEAWAPFVCELAVMVVRSAAGEVRSYPLVQTVQKDGVCAEVRVPAPVGASVAQTALDVALAAVGALPGAGVFGVELFALPTGHVLLNEVAPRPHNSGHFTIEACETSQFENQARANAPHALCRSRLLCIFTDAACAIQVRAALGWPLGSTALRVGAATMLNILGDGDDTGGRAHRLIAAAIGVDGASAHWYGKEPRAGRKLGHITVVGRDAEHVDRRVARLRSAAAAGDAAAAAAAAGGGCAGEAAGVAAVATRLAESRDDAAGAGEPSPPLVGIIMGSDSDLGCMSAAAAMLTSLGVPFELTIVSAHRTPARLHEYATAAAGRGLRVVIAGAGGAAHLPGMVASLTPLPVIGVPVPLKHLDGLDSLLSIVQMPAGIPVATVGLGNAANAGLLAARILAAGAGGAWGGEAALRAALVAHAAALEATVLKKAEKLEAVGWAAYMEEAAKR